MQKYFCDLLSVSCHSPSSAAGFAVGVVLSGLSCGVLLWVLL